MQSVISVFLMVPCPKKGAGDSERLSSPLAGFNEPAVDSGALQISHSSREGWFTKVHLGHGIGFPVCKVDAPPLILLLWIGISFPSRTVPWFVPGPSRPATAEMAAFRIVVKGGFMPHARQGGTLVDEVAVDGSKLEGTGLENEHMGQIQVAFTGWDAGVFICGPGT